MKPERPGGEETESSGRPVNTESPASTDRMMEEICERENLKEAMRRVKANKGSAGMDGMTVDQLPDYLKQHWPAIREQLLSGTYKPQAGETGGNPEAGRRGAQAGHSDGAGSFCSASGDAGSAKAVGPDVFRSQLWLPTGTVGASGGGAGAAVHRGRVRLGGGPGFGEILRSSQSRQTDGADRQTGRGQAAVETHPGILECRGDGERVGQSERGRDSARRTTFAPAEQPRARRTRPGAGAARPSLCSICGRLQHLRSQRTSGSTGDGEHQAIHHAAAQAQGERDEECGGAAAAAEVSRIQFHRRSGDSADDCAEGHGAVQGTDSGDHAQAKRCEHGARRWRNWPPICGAGEVTSASAKRRKCWSN